MKTAVEFLVEQICTSDMYNLIFREEIKQAKAMEKEQIVNAYDRGYKACDLDEALEINKTMFSGERYYNQTYNQTNVGNDGFEFDNSSTIPPPKTNNL